MLRLLQYAGFFLFSSPAMASGESGGGSHVLWEFLNLFILVAVLVLLSRRPVTSFLSARREKIVQNLESSEELLQESQARLLELEKKTSSLDDELDEIRSEAKARAEKEAAAIVTEAQDVARRIAEDAEAAVEREFLRAQKILRNEAAQLAMQLAEERLKSEITEEDQNRLVAEFVQRIRNGVATG